MLLYYATGPKSSMYMTRTYYLYTVFSFYHFSVLSSKMYRHSSVCDWIPPSLLLNKNNNNTIPAKIPDVTFCFRMQASASYTKLKTTQQLPNEQIIPYLSLFSQPSDHGGLYILSMHLVFIHNFWTNDKWISKIISYWIIFH